MRIAVDVCVGIRGVAMLRAAGHAVMSAEHGEPDRDWTARALAWGVEMFVSVDGDIAIFAYEHYVPLFVPRAGDRDTKIVERLLRHIERTAFPATSATRGVP